MALSKYGVLIATVFTLMSCKGLNRKNGAADHDQAIDVKFVRLTDADSKSKDKEKSLNWGKITFLDNGNKPGGRLVVSLDYFDTAQSGVLPKCMKAIDPGLQIAFLKCTKGNISKDQERIISASAADQTCYTAANPERHAATQVLQFPGCDEAVVHGYLFHPELRLSIEAL